MAVDPKASSDKSIRVDESEQNTTTSKKNLRLKTQTNPRSNSTWTLILTVMDSSYIPTNHDVYDSMNML